MIADSKEYKEGNDAFWNGVPFNDNPYQKGSPEYEEWNLGYKDNWDDGDNYWEQEF